MNKENFYNLIIVLVFLLLTLMSILIYIFLNQTALILMIFIIFLAAIFFFIQLYLKIQHNIDRVGSYDKPLQKTSNEFKKIRESSENIIDFLEILIKYLEELKNKETKTESYETFLKDKFNEITEMQKKMAAGVEDLFNSQYELTLKLAKDWEKKFDDFKMNINKIKNTKKR